MARGPGPLGKDPYKLANALDSSFGVAMAARKALKKSPQSCWWVFELGRPNPANMGRRPRYFLGKMSLPDSLQETAVAAARKRWPDKVGRMLLEQGYGVEAV